MILVVGATGLLGMEACRQLREAALPVKAVVRRGADVAKIENLRRLGAQLVEADLKQPSSLATACHGAKAIITTASSTLSRRQGDTIQSVDLEGQIHLIDAAGAAGVEHVIFISFRNNPTVQYPLTAAKRAVEHHLREAGLAYTILQASYFMEVWLTPALGFDVPSGRVRVYGGGRNRLSWVSSNDVARFAVKVLKEPRARDRIIEIGGPEALSPLDVVAAFEAAGSPEIAVEYVPEPTLRQQMETADDPLQESFAGLMLQYAAGDVIDMKPTLELLPASLTSIRDHVSKTLIGIERQRKIATA
jgi:uncharacterized protein YbjT (DUF2867 family)